MHTPKLLHGPHNPSPQGAQRECRWHVTNRTHHIPGAWDRGNGQAGADRRLLSPSPGQFHERITNPDQESSCTNPSLPYFTWMLSPTLWGPPSGSPAVDPSLHQSSSTTAPMTFPFPQLYKLLPTCYFRSYIATWWWKQKQQVWVNFPPSSLCLVFWNYFIPNICK